MSEEFTKVAMSEIIEELDANSQILKSCKTDEDLGKNSTELSKHLHKIKGIAPMAGFTKIGELASINHSLINKILDGEKITGILDIFNQSNYLMSRIIQNPSLDVDELKQRIKTKYSAFLD